MKSLSKPTIFLTQVIIKCKEKNLITNLRNLVIAKHILPVPCPSF